MLALCCAAAGAGVELHGDSTDAEYILGEAEGTASAMHWPTGLVWEALRGRRLTAPGNAQCSTSNKWPNWATSYLPKYFTDSGPCHHSAPSTRTCWSAVHGVWPAKTS
ncbi:MAG: hypothetical protein U1E74_03820 [Paenacidovorax caeni]